MVAGEEQPSDAQRGLQGFGAFDVDERTALGLGKAKLGSAPLGELFGQFDDGFQLLLADVAAAYGDGVAARVETAVVVGQAPAFERVVGDRKSVV